MTVVARILIAALLVACTACAYNGASLARHSDLPRTTETGCQR